jgi:opacity protein-like surface antigen
MSRHPLLDPTAPRRSKPHGGLASRITAVVALALAVGGWSLPAGAQIAGDGFLFHRPRASITLRGGWDGASARGDVFDFATDQLTLGRNDFRGPFGGVDLAFGLAPRIDATLSTTFSVTNAKSEFRDWIDDTSNLPIEQTTSLRRVPVTAGIRAYLLSRGQSVGQFAWVPARFSPYVGAGGGFMWYRFRQQGDFVDFQTTNIFFDDFQSSGWTPTANAALGLDYSLTPNVSLNAEAKYNWAKAKLGTDFSGFGDIDLSGYQTTLGLGFRF